MRIASVLFLGSIGLTSPGEAQVSVDMHALDSLGPARPRVAPVPPARPVSRSNHAATNRAAATPEKPAATNTPPPAPVPDSAPPVAVTPVPALPVQQPTPPPAATLAPAETAVTAPPPPPVRLLFEGGQADLTPDNEAAIRALAHAIPAPASESVNVLAYASGKPDDPSTARRLSLSRGMAVRSVLLASGVPSAQIYVRALGATATDGPADRVELSITPIGTIAR